MSINKLISELFALKAVKYYDRRKEQELKRKLIVLTMSWECNKLQNVAPGGDEAYIASQLGTGQETSQAIHFRIYQSCELESTKCTVNSFKARYISSNAIIDLSLRTIFNNRVGDLLTNLRPCLHIRTVN